MRTMQQVLFVIVMVLTLALPAAAQDGTEPEAPTAGSVELTDTRWLPWMGCWQLWEEQVDQAAEDGAEFPDRTIVCLTPADDGRGARLVARSDSDVLVERTLVADGVRQALTEGDCTGWERRDWSDDGRRLFTRGEIRCGSDEPRRMSGISMLANRSTWVDIQSVSVGDRGHMEIRRYNPARDAERSVDVRLPATPGAIRDARQSIAGPLSLSSVREAAAKAQSAVVEALLAETQPRLALDSATLIELDDAGVDGSVIDVLVALAYPDRFMLERRRAGGRGGGGGGGVGWGGLDPYSPMYGGRSWAPFGYSYLGWYGYDTWRNAYWYDPYYYSGWGRRGGLIGSVDDSGEQGSGRIVEGIGYTRVSERAAVTRDSGSAASGGRATGRGGSTSPRGGGRVTSGGYTRSGGGSSSSSGGGGSSSSGGGGGGRTAVPR